ncbi:MAG: lipid-A-disaccharide synthase [Desulfamplus sp.]|nr:lipid-A-disaccharide synthase [Desulfamplus sp.]
MKKKRHIMIIAGEPSGDLHGANLIKELKDRGKFSIENGSFTDVNQSLIITGIGGDLMAEAGMNLFFHIKDLSVMGLTEVIAQFWQIKRAFELFQENIIAKKPDLLILIDYPGFNLKAAKFAKQRDVPVLYYIAPKVWAWNRARLKKIKQYVDHVAFIFPFEELIFKKAKIPATYVGNPLLDCYVMDSFLSNNTTDKITIGILPGSRESEIASLFEIMLQSANIISKSIRYDSKFIQFSNIDFLISAASSININKFNNILEPYNKDNQFEVIRGEPSELFRRCDILIAASGTVTLEAAIFGLPMVIVYKTSSFTYFIAKHFVKIPYIGLPNIVAKYQIVPELLQHNATPEKIANQILLMLNPATLAYIKKRLLMVPRYLGGSGAAKRVSKIAMQMLKS